MCVINKVTKGPAAVLLPLPAVMVTCGEGKRANIITIAWTGIMNSDPPIMYIAVRPVGRHSYSLLKESGEYVINLPTVEQAKTVDYCGMVSGKDVDKFAKTGLTPLPAAHVKAPLIGECPVNIECKVRQVIPLGSHDVFMADVLAVHYNQDVLDEKGRPDISKLKPYGFCVNDYRTVTDKIGFFGFSRKEP